MAMDDNHADYSDEVGNWIPFAIQHSTSLRR